MECLGHWKVTLEEKTMTDIWFTSDMHYGHHNIIEYTNRPFSGVTEMNEALIDNWNATVNDGDIVYVLGDVAMGKIEDSLALLPRLKGFKRLIPGNHDRCWKGNGKKHEPWIKRYADVGFDITTQSSITVDNHIFMMDHFPYRGESEIEREDRYTEWRLQDKGLWLLCGHVHDAWTVQDRCINVGVDVWEYKPVHIDTLLEVRLLNS